jgi:serine/threonine protein kinase
VEATLTCPYCNTALPADAPEGLCPSCLLRDVSRIDVGEAAIHDEPAPVPDFPGLEILEELAPGVGGMGVVYRAREPSLDRIVAVKTTKSALTTSEGRELFRREARAAARLDHPHILRIFRYDPDSTPPFFVMQYVDGRPLDVAAAGRGHDPAFIAGVLEKVARALAYAHGRGVVHRDIKPRNILIDADGEPRVADFGLASLPREGASGASQPQLMRSLVGTPPFVAPEVYAGDGSAGASVDVYALGVTMYELLTGRLPFGGRDIERVRDAVLTVDPPLPQDVNPAVPEQLQRICLKAMERDPAARYESAAALAEDLRRFREGRQVAARPTRYQAELKGKLQNHLTDIRLWQEQNLIDVRDMDRLSLPYQATLAASTPVHQLARRFPWETVVLRLGGWLVLLSSVLWPAFYWDRISRWERIVAVALPALLINGVGWVLLARRSRINALVYLSTGALLLPLTVAVVLVESRLLEYRQSDARELFATPRYEDGGVDAAAERRPIERVGDTLGYLVHHTAFTTYVASSPAPRYHADAPTSDAFAPTNMQLTIAAGVFVVYCLFVLLKTQASILTMWVGIGLYLWAACVALRAGLKEWLETEDVSRALLVCLAFSLVFWPLALLLRRRPALAGGAVVSYTFFLLPFVAALSLLTRFGAVEWLNASPDLEDELINLWLMCNGLIYSAAAIVSYRSNISFVRFWGTLLLLLVPLHFLGPMNLLWEEGQPLFTLGDAPLKTYELASLLVALLLVVIGTRLRLHTLALPALMGLAVFIFRATSTHFTGELAWPLGLAATGGSAMVAALASLLWRVHRQREAMI